MVAVQDQAKGEGEGALKTRRRLLKLISQLETQYATWKPTHQDIIQYIQPNRGVFDQTDTNRGDRKDHSVVNNTASDNSRKLTAAIDTGGQSEAREWFTLSPENPLDAESPGVREYLHSVQSILFSLIAKSNYYTASRNVIEDLVGPAIGLMMIVADDEDVFRCTHYPIGTFRVWSDSKGRVAGFAAPSTFTAEQMAEEFGAENCSPGVQRALDQDQGQAAKFTVWRVVEKRKSRQPGKITAKNKPWASYWLELGAGMLAGGGSAIAEQSYADPVGPSGLLRESGYDEQPFTAPRWEAIGLDAYGKNSPGWNGLGDTMALQALEKGSAKGIALIMQPPMGVPANLKNASYVPGALWQRPDNSSSAIEPIVKIPPELVTVTRQEKQDLAARLNRTFFGDVLFLISNDEHAEPRTAEEIRGQKEERLLQLGGVFSRFANEHLKPAISRMFAIGQRAGLFPPPPPQLLKSGKIRIDFQNPLVTAQKTIGFTAMQQLVSFSIACAQAQAAGVDKIDFDEAQDTAADMLGVKPNLLKDDQRLAEERKQKAAQAQAQATGSAMTQAAPAIKDLSNSDPEKLQQLLAMFGGNAQAQGQATA